MEMIDEIGPTFDLICLPCGTGGTLAGILEGLKGKYFIIGFPVMKNGSFLRKNIDSLTHDFSGETYTNYKLNTKYHFGGYARYGAKLIRFINNFRRSSGIRLDPVYTGKMMFGIFDLIRQGIIQNNTRILVLHTGGLQGIAGFNRRFGHLID